MPESRFSRGLFTFLTLGAAGILSVILIYAVRDCAGMFASYNLPLLAASLVVAAGIVVIGRKLDWGNRIPNGIFTALVIFLTLAPRLFWVLAVRTEPYSDFLHMHNYGAAVSRGEFTNYVDFYAVSPFKFGFGFLMGGIYYIFGPNPLAAGLFNVFLSLLQVWLVYLIAREIKQESARAAAIFFALWPAHIMYCNLVAAENSFFVPFLAAIYFFVRYVKHNTEGWKGYALLALSGALLAVSQVMRPLGMLFIIVMAIYVFLFARYRQRQFKGFLRRVVCVLAAIAAYYGTLKAMSIPVKNLSGIDLTKTGSGYYLMVGTNFEANGMFNWNDFYFMRDHNFDFDEVNREGTKLAIERIKADPLRFMLLVLKKIDYQWGRENYGYYWSLLSASGGNPAENFIKLHPRLFSVASQIYYLVILFLGIIGCYSAYKEKNPLPAMMYLVIGGMFVAYWFLEVQARYHITAVPLFIILAALGAREIKNMHFDRK